MIKQSWQKITTVLLIVTLALTSIFFVFTYTNYNNKIKNATIQENTSIAKQWASLINARLNTLYEHVYDNFVYLYDNTPLKSGSQTLDPITNKSVMDVLTNKLLVSKDADAFFVSDTESSLFLFAGSNAHSEVKQLSLKNALRKTINTLPTSGLGDYNWSVVSLENGIYFYKGIKLGKYICGVVSSIDKYSLEDSLTTMGYGTSAFLINNGNVYYISGEKSLIDSIDTNNLKERYIGEYAFSIYEHKLSDSYVAILAKPESYLKGDAVVPIILLLDSALCIVVVIVLIIYTDKRIKEPTGKLIEANNIVASGNLSYYLDENKAGSKEFEELYASYNTLVKQIEQLKIEQYDSKINEEKNKLMMLRAQVRPHTFLNALTTVNNMTFDKDPEDIRKYINRFAKFTRYMLQTESEFTTIKEEIEHIKNYIELQQTRTDQKITLNIDCDESIKESKIPFLIFFTLVENSLKHNIVEGDEIIINIKAKEYETDGFKGVRLIEEDNGDGFSKESIEKLLNAPEQYTKEHLGLTNARYSLNLIYRRNDLMSISNNENGGAHVEILIPEGDKSDENTSM